MRQRKINMNKLRELLDSGKTQSECAAHFGVSDAAVSKAVKRLPPSMAGLNEREQRFVQAKAAGKPNAEAVKQAGYNCSSQASARAYGSELMAKEEIRTKIGELMEFHGYGTEYRTKKLGEHIDNADPQISLRALDLSFRLSDEFPSQRHVIERPLEIFVIGYQARRDGQEQLEDLAQDVEFSEVKRKDSN